MTDHPTLAVRYNGRRFYRGKLYQQFVAINDKVVQAGTDLSFTGKVGYGVRIGDVYLIKKTGPETYRLPEAHRWLDARVEHPDAAITDDKRAELETKDFAAAAMMQQHRMTKTSRIDEMTDELRALIDRLPPTQRRAALARVFSRMM